jgi:hypothetical protein
MIVLKLRGARQRAKIHFGKCEGRHSFGVKPGEKETLDLMFFLRSEGNKPEQIAGILNAKGILARGTKKKGRGPWRASTIAKILARQSVK